ncbi:MAG: TldD/PmbA family protein [Halobacteriovoraceae bacterium]|jgi:PmbA protein|nr:TldD/PmbA family protein [Halobacteriovoraceae bacterium]
MDQNLKRTLEKTVEVAKKNGADSCDAILSKGNSFSLNAMNGEIDKYKVSGAQVIGLRVIKDSKVGIAYTESLDDDAIKFAAKAAIENAQNSEINEFEDVAIKSGEYLNESKYQKDGVATEDKIAFCLKLESDVKERDSRIQSVPYNGFSEVESSSYYMNSYGVFGYASEYYQSCYTSALLQEGSESSMHYHGDIGRKLSDLNNNKCVDESIEHAVAWLQAKPLVTGHYDVIFTPDVLSEIFGCFSNIYSGKGAMEKTNPFADKIGQKVANNQISISDLPQYKDAFFHEFFDSEGVAHKDLTLIKDGVLCSFYHNTATANYFKTSTTGHAARSAKSSLGVSGTTKVIGSGKTPFAQVTDGQYFEIHSLQGLGSGSNAISGEFSAAASGYLCRDGKREQPVKGVTVSGNFHKMILGVDIIGDKTVATDDRSFFAPQMRFESMSIAGI